MVTWCPKMEGIPTVSRSQTIHDLRETSMSKTQAPWTHRPNRKVDMSKNMARHSERFDVSNSGANSGAMIRAHSAIQ